MYIGVVSPITPLPKNWPGVVCTFSKVASVAALYIDHVLRLYALNVPGHWLLRIFVPHQDENLRATHACWAYPMQAQILTSLPHTDFFLMYLDADFWEFRPFFFLACPMQGVSDAAFQTVSRAFLAISARPELNFAVLFYFVLFYFWPSRRGQISQFCGRNSEKSVPYSLILHTN